MTALLPCPFCNSPAALQPANSAGQIFIGCTGCTTSQAPIPDTEAWREKAAWYWNSFSKNYGGQ